MSNMLNLLQTKDDKLFFKFSKSESIHSSHQ